jgi:hypothetical protein
MKTASPPLFFPPSAAPGYGAAPPASRVATAIAARRAYGPPLTPQPLRPLTAQPARAGAQPLPAQTARRSAHIKIKVSTVPGDCQAASRHERVHGFRYRGGRPDSRLGG